MNSLASTQKVHLPIYNQDYHCSHHIVSAPPVAEGSGNWYHDTEKHRSTPDSKFSVDIKLKLLLQ